MAQHELKENTKLEIQMPQTSAGGGPYLHWKIWTPGNTGISRGFNNAVVESN